MSIEGGNFFTLTGNVFVITIHGMGKNKSAAKGGRPPKPPETAKSRLLQVRVQEVEQASFAAAAELSGMDVSAWVRLTLRGAARKELRNGGKTIPFLE
jgi:hypothetical protein